MPLLERSVTLTAECGPSSPSHSMMQWKLPKAGKTRQEREERASPRAAPCIMLSIKAKARCRAGLSALSSRSVVRAAYFSYSKSSLRADVGIRQRINDRKTWNYAIRAYNVGAPSASSRMHRALGVRPRAVRPKADYNLNN